MDINEFAKDWLDISNACAMPNAMENIKDQLTEEGFLIAQHFYADRLIDEIIEHLNAHNALAYNKQETSGFNLIKSIPYIKDLANAEQLISLVKLILGSNAYPVNAFVLDKTKEHNWGLDWHQDLKIAVKRKIETQGYNQWTVEYGIPHTIPPQEILKKRLFVRIHLDDCFIENGAMLVAPRSHKLGILKNRTKIEKITNTGSTCCEIEKGGMMLFLPLLLHKSPYSKSNKKRRILQIEYVGTSLANELEWYY